ncbi:histamine N-methyltransferase A-like [Diadema antillarum]|uniref:histamine N-methyltransferase A-like n=1 Tax=Diadema antillarum TaxID=105358 RepID=UPI003A87659E
MLTTDLAHYSKTYDVFVEKSGKYASDRKWAEENFPALVVHKLGENRPSDHTLRSLGVGSGSGDYDILLLRMLSQRFTRFNHVVVEPARVFLEHFQSAVPKESSSGTRSILGAANFEWLNETLQEYMAKKSGRSAEGSPQQFDFISAVHSLYYVDDLRGALQFLYDSLAPGGILLITFKRDTSKRSMHGFRKEDHYNAADAKQILSELNIPYTISEQRIILDITSIFDEGSTEGNLLLDFLTHFCHFRETATKDMQDAVLTKYKERVREYREAMTDVESRPPSGGSCDKENVDEHALVERLWENLIITKA